MLNMLCFVGRGPKKKGALDRPQLLHPGMASALDRASAHDSPVTSLQGTPDGLYLFSTGTVRFQKCSPKLRNVGSSIKCSEGRGKSYTATR